MQVIEDKIISKKIVSFDSIEFILFEDYHRFFAYKVNDDGDLVFIKRIGFGSPLSRQLKLQAMYDYLEKAAWVETENFDIDE